MNFSIEVFPPKSLKGEVALKQNLKKIKTIQPRFISATCGASGQQNVQNYNVCQMILDLDIPCVAHLVCQGFDVEQNKQRIERYHRMGIRSILALRGDASPSTSALQGSTLSYAKDLNILINSLYPNMGIYNAGYPQGHQENPDKKADFKHQLDKLQTRSQGVITQLFFANSHFIDYHQKLREAGYQGEIIAGIFPITQVAQITKITSMCAVEIPPKLKKKLLQYQDDAQSILQIGIDYAVEQCLELAQHGLYNYHLYSMNQAEHIIEIHRQVIQHQDIFLEQKIAI